jgi:hypothetical protein
MVKLVDTKDLKSFGHCGHAGSIPAPGTESDSSLFSAGIFFSSLQSFSTYLC